MSSPTSHPRTSRLYHAEPRPPFSALAAIGLTLAAVASLLVAIALTSLTRAPLAVVAAAGQLGLVSVPIIAALATGRGLAITLGLRLPPARLLLSALLLGSTFWYLNLRLVDLLPFDPADRAPLQLAVEQPSLPLVLLCIAIAPAVCEEILFRGVLLPGLATRVFPWVAVVLSAVLFSLYHLNPIQMIPTFTLGVALALLAARAGGSVLPSILAHGLNNAIAILVARFELPRLADRTETGLLDLHPTVSLGIAGLLAIAGVGLALHTPRSPHA